MQRVRFDFSITGVYISISTTAASFTVDKSIIEFN